MFSLAYLFIIETILKRTVFSKQISSDNVELSLVILEEWRLKKSLNTFVFLKRPYLEEPSLPGDIDNTQDASYLLMTSQTQTQQIPLFGF